MRRTGLGHQPGSEPGCPALRRAALARVSSPEEPDLLMIVPFADPLAPGRDLPRSGCVRRDRHDQFSAEGDGEALQHGDRRHGTAGL